MVGLVERMTVTQVLQKRAGFNAGPFIYLCPLYADDLQWRFKLRNTQTLYSFQKNFTIIVLWKI